jgi:hypothetical protein
MRFSSGFLTALVAVSVAVTMGMARAEDNSQITLLCQTTGSSGEKTGARTVHINLDTREVSDTQVYDHTIPIITNQEHGRITRITDQVIAWKSYEIIVHYGETNSSLVKYPYADQAPEVVVDRYTLTITSSQHTSQCTLQTRKF